MNNLPSARKCFTCSRIYLAHCFGTESNLISSLNHILLCNVSVASTFTFHPLNLLLLFFCTLKSSNTLNPHSVLGFTFPAIFSMTKIFPQKVIHGMMYFTVGPLLEDTLN